MVGEPPWGCASEAMNRPHADRTLGGPRGRRQPEGGAEQSRPVFRREFKPPGLRLGRSAGPVEAHAERTQAFTVLALTSLVSENLTVSGHSLDDLGRSSESSSYGEKLFKQIH